MKLKIEADHPLHVHADGTLIGTLPIEVVSIPRAVRVALPSADTMLTPRPRDEVAAQPAAIETS